MVDQDSPKKSPPLRFFLRFHCNCYNCWTNKFLRYTKASIFDIRTVSSGHEYRGENMITTGAVLSTMRVFLEATKRATMNEFPHGSKSEAIQLGVYLIILYFPPGRKSVASQLGVHLILLYFIRIPLPNSPPQRLLFYFDGGLWIVGGVPFFGSLNLLIIIWYIV